MKNYQSFLSEQKNVATSSGLGYGGNINIDAGHDTPIMNSSSVNIFRHGEQAYDWGEYIMSLPELSTTYNHQQLITIFKRMSEREKRKVLGDVESLKNFRSKETIGMLAHSLEKAQTIPQKFEPKLVHKWGRY